jgi:hypothetical protein
MRTSFNFNALFPGRKSAEPRPRPLPPPPLPPRALPGWFVRCAYDSSTGKWIPQQPLNPIFKPEDGLVVPDYALWKVFDSVPKQGLTIKTAYGSVMTLRSLLSGFSDEIARFMVRN